MEDTRGPREILPSILSASSRTRDAARARGELVARTTIETRRKIEAGEIAIRVVPEYREVMARYRRSRDVEFMAGAAAEYGTFTDVMIVDPEGGILKGHRLWEAAHLLRRSNAVAHGPLVEQIVQNCVVLLVNGIEDARAKIRAAHLASIGSLTETDLNDVTADQMREYQRLIDEHLEDLLAAVPGMTGRVRFSSNLVARKLGTDNKRVDRVLANSKRYPDLAELVYLPCIDARGVIQKDRNLPGESGGRGRKPRCKNDRPDSSKATEPTGRLERPKGPENTEAKPAASPTASDPADPPSGSGSTQEVTTETGFTPDADGRHWAVEAVREAVLGAKETPSWPTPAVPFSGALDELPPADPASALAGGGVGISHLLHVARLLERKGQGCIPLGWSDALDAYVGKVLESFEAWRSAWDKAGEWTTP